MPSWLGTSESMMAIFLVAGAGVNPADQSWGFWPLLPLSSQLLEQV